MVKVNHLLLAVAIAAGTLVAGATPRPAVAAPAIARQLANGVYPVYDANHVQIGVLYVWNGQYEFHYLRNYAVNPE